MEQHWMGKRCMRMFAKGLEPWQVFGSDCFVGLSMLRVALSLLEQPPHHVFAVVTYSRHPLIPIGLPSIPPVGPWAQQAMLQPTCTAPRSTSTAAHCCVQQVNKQPTTFVTSQMHS
jgi:hypothetical protein